MRKLLKKQIGILVAIVMITFVLGFSFRDFLFPGFVVGSQSLYDTRENPYMADYYLGSSSIKVPLTSACGSNKDNTYTVFYFSSLTFTQNEDPVAVLIYNNIITNYDVTKDTICYVKGAEIFSNIQGNGWKQKWTAFGVIDYDTETKRITCTIPRSSLPLKNAGDQYQPNVGSDNAWAVICIRDTGESFDEIPDNYCGDGVCDSSESSISCPDDCYEEPGPQPETNMEPIIFTAVILVLFVMLLIAVYRKKKK